MAAAMALLTVSLVTIHSQSQQPLSSFLHTLRSILSVFFSFFLCSARKCSLENGMTLSTFFLISLVRFSVVIVSIQRKIYIIFMDIDFVMWARVCLFSFLPLFLTFSTNSYFAKKSSSIYFFWRSEIFFRCLAVVTFGIRMFIPTILYANVFCFQYFYSFSPILHLLFYLRLKL